MIITSIQKQKSNTNKFLVFIDYDYAFSIDENEMIVYNIETGMELSDELYGHIVQNEIYNKAKKRALNMLSYSDKTKKEVYDKLKRENYTDETANQVIEFLEKYNYINDELYAKKYIEYKSRTSMDGMTKIKYDLSKKGIDFRDIDLNDLLEQSDEIGSAKKLIENKINTSRIDPENIDDKEKNKIYNYLYRKGYTYDIIKSAFNEYIISLEDGDDDYDYST